MRFVGLTAALDFTVSENEHKLAERSQNYQLCSLSSCRLISSPHKTCRCFTPGVDKSQIKPGKNKPRNHFHPLSFPVSNTSIHLLIGCLSGCPQKMFGPLTSSLSDFASLLSASHANAVMEFMFEFLCSPDAWSHSTAACRR